MHPMRPPQRRPQAPARPGPTISFPVPGPASQPEIRPLSQRSSTTCDCGIRSPLSSCPFATSLCAWDARSWSLLSLNPVLQPLAPCALAPPGRVSGRAPCHRACAARSAYPGASRPGEPGGSSVQLEVSRVPPASPPYLREGRPGWIGQHALLPYFRSCSSRMRARRAATAAPISASSSGPVCHCVPSVEVRRRGRRSIPGKQCRLVGRTSHAAAAPPHLAITMPAPPASPGAASKAGISCRMRLPPAVRFPNFTRDFFSCRWPV
jgi:hypothetical protein